MRTDFVQNLGAISELEQSLRERDNDSNMKIRGGLQRCVVMV
jgi:hypothetical protein